MSHVPSSRWNFNIDRDVGFPVLIGKRVINIFLLLRPCMTSADLTAMKLFTQHRDRRVSNSKIHRCLVNL